MKAHTFTFPLATALLALGAGCSSGPEYSQYPAQYPTAQYPAPATRVDDHNQTKRGAVGGAVAGAVLGGVIGSNSDKVSTEQGAAIGAVAGGLAGAAIGNRADQRENARAPVYTSADTGYTVRSVPLAPVSEPQEAIPPQPAASAVWIRGHYTYAGNGYQWQPGRWEVPPVGARTYIGPSWQPNANGGYVYVRGHWQ